MDKRKLLNGGVGNSKKGLRAFGFLQKIKKGLMVGGCAVVFVCASLSFLVGGFSALFGGFSFSSSELKAQAFNSSNESEAISINEIWNDTEKKFNGKELLDLIKKTSGTSATLKDLSPLNNLTRNSNEMNTSNGKDIIVTLGTLRWTPVYLSNATGSNDPILTLWLSNSQQLTNKDVYSNGGTASAPPTKMKFNTNSAYSTWNAGFTETDTVTNRPDNMYGTSYIRAVTLNNGGLYTTATNGTNTKTVDKKTLTGSVFSPFTITSTNNSVIADYLVAPATVSWQENQSFKTQGQWTAFPFNYDLSNEGWALNQPDTNYNSANYNYSKKGALGYDTWKNDLLWLPSYTETGRSDFPMRSLWKVSSDQQRNEGRTMTRSAFCYGGQQVYDSSGGDYQGVSSSLQIVRPALHLNLKKASENVVNLEIPTSVETTYNGSKINFFTLYDVGSSILSITEISGQDYINAGTCTATATLLASQYNFEGLSESVRSTTITINIKKKPISLTITQANETTIPTARASGVCSGDTGDREPQIAFKYSGNGLTDSTSPPTSSGTYTATAYIVNNNNYELDNTYTKTYKVNKTKVTKPTIDRTSDVYIGSDLTFSIRNFEKDKYKITCSNSAVTIDNSLGTVKMKNAGNYTITLELLNTANYEWDSTSGDANNPTYTIKIDKKTLNIGFDITIENSGFVQTASGFEFTLNPNANPAQTPPKIKITTDQIANGGIGEDIGLDIYYYNSNNVNIKYMMASNIVVDANKLGRIITFPLNNGSFPFGIGDYSLEVKLSENVDINQNYNIFTANNIKSQHLIVKGSQAVYNGVTWQYVNKEKNTTKNIDTTTNSFVYNGACDIKIDTTALQGIEVDITKGSSGYSANCTNAKNVGSYIVTVYLKVSDGYTPPAQFNGTVNYTFKITKAKYDLTGVQWVTLPDKNAYNADDGLQYSGSTQTIILNGLDERLGLSANYSSNAKAEPGTYNAIANYSVEDTTNYYLPDSTNPNTYIYTGTGDVSSLFSISWKIVPRVLVADWTSSSDVGEGETEKKGVVIPKLRPIGELKVNDLVEYNYTIVNSSGTEEPVTDKSTIGTIKAECTYYVYATILETYRAYYTFETQPKKMFKVGKDVVAIKIIVKIDDKPLQLQYRYTGKPFKISVEIPINSAGVVASDLAFHYYKCVKESKDFHNVRTDLADDLGETIPTGVGFYHCLIRVVGKENAEINGDYDEFLFDIVNATFDVSMLQWEYTHEGANTSQYGVLAQQMWTYLTGETDSEGNDIRTENAKFTYDGKTHNFTLKGFDSLPTGLSAVIKVNGTAIGGNTFSHTNATYKNGTAVPIAVSVEFAIAESMQNSYTLPTFVGQTLNIIIERTVLDASETKWGYTVGDTVNAEEKEFGSDNGQVTSRASSKAQLVFARGDNNSTIDYVVKLIHLPEMLKEHIEYPDRNNVKSLVGKYTSTFKLKNTFIADNYVAVKDSLHSNLPYSFDWEIIQRRFDVPVLATDNTWTKFDNREHNVVDLLRMSNNKNLPADWYLYFDIKITKDGKEYTGLEEGKELILKDFGTYRFKFVKTDDNVAWNDIVKDVNLVVEKLNVKVTQWNNSGSFKAEAVFENFNGEFDNLFEYVYYLRDDDNNIDETNPIPYDSVVLMTNKKLVKRFKLLDSLKDNKNIELTGNVDALFEVGDIPGISLLNAPTQEEIAMFTGSVIDIATGLKDFNHNIMEILEIKTSTETIITAEEVINVDTYIIKIGLKNKEDYRWNTNARTTGTTDDIFVEFKISKRQLKGSWKSNNNGIPEFVLEQAEGEPNFSDKIKVTYFDENDNEIEKSKFESGKKYIAKVSLLDNDSFEFFSDNPDATDTTPANQEFTYRDTSIIGIVTDFVKNNYLYLAIGLGALLLLLLLLFLIGKRRKKEKEENGATTESKATDDITKSKDGKKIELAETKGQPTYPNFDYMQLQQNGMLQSGMLQAQQMQAQQQMAQNMQMQAQQQMAQQMQQQMAQQNIQQQMQQQMAQNMQAQQQAQQNMQQQMQMQMQQEMERQRQKQEIELERMKHEQEIEKLKNEMRSSQMQQNPQQQYANKDIQELREEVRQLTRYQVASPEEKSLNNRLANVETMLQQFLMSNFQNTPKWVPFNNKDMVNYDLNDLMKIYDQAKAIAQNNVENAKPKKQQIIIEQAEEFENRVSEYNKQKEDSKYEELLREMREKFDRMEADNKELKQELERNKNQQTEKELELTKQELLRKESEFARSREELAKKENELARKESELTKKQDEIETLKEKSLNEKLDEALKKNDK